mgnify:CR=1 FL=1
MSRPRYGFIRPNGTWAVGPAPGPDAAHAVVAGRELRRRGWRAVNLPGVANANIATLLIHGYVRVTGGCGFEVFALGDLTPDARAEVEATAREHVCGDRVAVDQVVWPHRAHLDGTARFGSLAAFVRGRR